MRAARCLRSDAGGLLAPILGRRTDVNGVHSLADLVARGDPWAIYDEGGQAVACYVLQDFGRGLLWITAAAGRAGVDLCQVIDSVTMSHARGAYREVGFRTERRGLVRKVEKLGYYVQRQEGPAYFLRKNVQ